MFIIIFNYNDNNLQIDLSKVLTGKCEVVYQLIKSKDNLETGSKKNINLKSINIENKNILILGIL